ncbi:MAG: DUF1905 domain-containing protein [Sphingomicrobium sp.]
MTGSRCETRAGAYCYYARHGGKSHFFSIEAVMITVTAPLWLWSGGQGSWHFVTVPEEQSAEIRAETFAGPRGFGSVRVEATINDVSWRTSVFPQKSGGYILPVKAEVRSTAGIAAGDEVTVKLKLL